MPDPTDPDDDSDYDLGVLLVVFGVLFSSAAVSWLLAYAVQWLWLTYWGA